MERSEHLGFRGKPIPVLTYRFGGDWSKTFFAPAHEFDKRIRRDMWDREADHEMDCRLWYRSLMHGTTSGRPTTPIEEEQ